ncbi:hypothetical protein COHA_000844 [Chlorella ohadii]|uniref:AAA+ ATPase domain-containing protein n=1 Tax=Chlorella ohadii TaxID=2649997 RepID=A0AAD5H8Q0_9CHLO|nr:hypothetical protein COHA_000844 [Chlorella ohadii]
MDDVLEALREALSWPALYAHEAAQLGVRWPKAVLLHGPPGCGKTAAVHAVARECGAVLHLITASSVVGAFTGESERRLRDAFAAATRDARSGRPVVIFLDERVGPSMARGAAMEVDPVSWDDVGGLEDVKQKLKQAVEWPLQHADAFQRLGLSPPRGVLLHGPPGCSKTTLVRAAATASGATFIALSGAQLYSMYVGEGEAILRDTFRRARLVAPSIVFLDELDSLVGKRVEGEQTGEVTARLLSSFLTEMDGMELAHGVLVMGATNRPQALDAALVRQGAELAAVCREAAMAALREDVQGASVVHHRHFALALEGIHPQLSVAELAKYEQWLTLSALGA